MKPFIFSFALLLLLVSLDKLPLEARTFGEVIAAPSSPTLPSNGSPILLQPNMGMADGAGNPSNSDSSVGKPDSNNVSDGGIARAFPEHMEKNWQASCSNQFASGSEDLNRCFRCMPSSAKTYIKLHPADDLEGFTGANCLSPADQGAAKVELEKTTNNPSVPDNPFK